MSEAIRLENVDFAYPGGGPVLEDAGLVINEGEPALIIGPNGGGKTTLLKVILGLLKPQRGFVKVFGMPPEKARPLVGYVPQHSLFDRMFPVSVADVVLMGRVERRLMGPYSAEDRKAALDAMEEMNVAGLADRSFAELSGGQRQRVLMARALAGSTRLLLLDEPTSSADPAVEERMMEIFQTLGKRITIVTVSHDLGFVSDIFKNVVCVNRRVRTHHTAEITGELVSEVYGRSLRMVHHRPMEGCEKCSHS